MKHVHLPAVDLNLLVALDALLESGSVTGAARKVGLSQSAMSHALGRLRDLFGDPLFVRSSRGLTPTPRARKLRDPLGGALAQVRGLLEPPAPFEPARSELTFRFEMVDFHELVILPRLLSRLAVEAPLVQIAASRSPRDPYTDLIDDVADLAFTVSRPREASLCHTVLFEEGFVCLVRPGHPGVSRDGTRFLLARFAGASHIVIRTATAGISQVERTLQRAGVRRRIAVSTPSFLVAPYLLSDTDLVFTAPERVARAVAPQLGLRIVQPPVRLPVFSVSMVWHARHDDDPAHRWLRGLILDAVAGTRATRARSA